MKLFPLSSRKSFISASSTYSFPPLSSAAKQQISNLFYRIFDKRILVIYGAHLVKNRFFTRVNEFCNAFNIIHFATNGAGIIHDMELGLFSVTSESVEENVANGTFGCWKETQITFWNALQNNRMLGLGSCMQQLLRGTNSIAGATINRNIPLTSHVGIGYDIISCSDYFDGGLLGSCSGIDFRKFCNSLAEAEVIINIGSSVMGPQITEKALSCVNNHLIHERKIPKKELIIANIDLEPVDFVADPSNSAYYKRNRKTFTRISSEFHDICCDNIAFINEMIRLAAN